MVMIKGKLLDFCNEIGNLDESSDEVDSDCDSLKFRKSSTIIFDKNVKCPNWVVGMVFESVEQFKLVLGSRLI